MDIDYDREEAPLPAESSSSSLCWETVETRRLGIRGTGYADGKLFFTFCTSLYLPGHRPSTSSPEHVDALSSSPNVVQLKFQGLERNALSDDVLTRTPLMDKLINFSLPTGRNTFVWKKFEREREKNWSEENMFPLRSGSYP